MRAAAVQALELEARREPPAPMGSTPRERFDWLYETIRERICLLRYPPGTTLSETELATAFGISRTPIRRVLQALEADGLVETKQSVGTIVTTVDLKSLRDAYALRMRLAESLGDLSPTARPETRLPALRALLDRVERVGSRLDLEEVARINDALQDLLAGLSDNREFRRISEQLYYRTIRAYYQILPELDWAVEAAALREEIAEIVDSLEAADVRAAGYVRRNHIARNLVRITRYMLGHGTPAATGEGRRVQPPPGRRT